MLNRWHTQEVKGPRGGGGGAGGGAVSRLERDRLRLAILDEASIVCSTLSFAGSPLLQRMSRKWVPACCPAAICGSFRRCVCVVVLGELHWGRGQARWI